MAKYFVEILTENQKKVLSKLSFLTNVDLYLAGGTALALQLGHRTSLDFDFYTKKHLDPADLYEKIEKIFGKDVSQAGQAKDTLFCNIKGVDVSFFWYQYPLLRKPIKILGVNTASVEDIAAMKLIAISRRPAERDYVDVFFLLKRFELKEMFLFAKKKYPNINSYFSLRALTYFEDLRKDERRKIKILDETFSWEKAKGKILEEVKNYQLSMIKK